MEIRHSALGPGRIVIPRKSGRRCTSAFISKLGKTPPLFPLEERSCSFPLFVSVLYSKQALFAVSILLLFATPNVLKTQGHFPMCIVHEKYCYMTSSNWQVKRGFIEGNSSRKQWTMQNNGNCSFNIGSARSLNMTRSSVSASSRPRGPVRQAASHLSLGSSCQCKLAFVLFLWAKLYPQSSQSFSWLKAFLKKKKNERKLHCKLHHMSTSVQIDRTKEVCWGRRGGGRQIPKISSEFLPFHRMSCFFVVFFSCGEIAVDSNLPSKWYNWKPKIISKM